jgi:hypothetical protein
MDIKEGRGAKDRKKEKASIQRSLYVFAENPARKNHHDKSLSPFFLYFSHCYPIQS